MSRVDALEQLYDAVDRLNRQLLDRLNDSPPAAWAAPFEQKRELAERLERLLGEGAPPSGEITRLNAAIQRALDSEARLEAALRRIRGALAADLALVQRGRTAYRQSEASGSSKMPSKTDFTL